VSWFKFGFGKKKKDQQETADAAASEASADDTLATAPEGLETAPGEPAVPTPDPEAPLEPDDLPPEAQQDPLADAEIGDTVDRPGETAEPAGLDAPEDTDTVVTPVPDAPADAIDDPGVPAEPSTPEADPTASASDAEAPVPPEEPSIPAADADADPALAPSQDEPAPADGVSDTGDRKTFLARIASGLKKSSSRFSESVSAVFTKRKLDDAALEELEDLLIAADLGARAAGRVTARLARDRFDKDVNPLEVKEALAEVVTEILEPYAQPLDMSGPSPRVVLFVGVNGSGKTTTLGKIAVKMTREGADIITAAGDTFRAAAVEQLEIWSQRANAKFLSRPLGADAAGLAFDAFEAGRRDGADAVLIDTAGRLQNKAELMDELRKIVRVLKKQDETAPHHVILVLDGTVGSNAISQAEAFLEAANVTGVIMTKLDGTAKGGALVQVAEKFQLPIHFIGVGEGEADLTAFDARAFARALAGLEG